MLMSNCRLRVVLPKYFFDSATARRPVKPRDDLVDPSANALTRGRALSTKPVEYMVNGVAFSGRRASPWWIASSRRRGAEERVELAR